MTKRRAASLRQLSFLASILRRLQTVSSYTCAIHCCMMCLKVQSVQNVAPKRLVNGVRWCDRITAILHQLHWLPVRRRVVYTVARWVHQSLSCEAPAYLANDINLVSTVDAICSDRLPTRHYVVLRAQNSSGDRSLCDGGPLPFCCRLARAQNDLPSRTCDGTSATDSLDN